MNKKILSGLVLFFIGVITALLINEGLKPEILPVGSEIPKISFTAKNGNVESISGRNLTRLPDGQVNQIPVLIIYFSSECTHCIYELEEINNNIEKFKNINIYLFTTEKDFFSMPDIDGWEKLYNTFNIKFGIVDKNNYEQNFGSMVTPSIFIFNEQNKLTKKILGEIKIGTLIEYLNSA